MSCTLNEHSYTGTSAREWKRASSPKHEKTSPPSKRITKRLAPRASPTTTSKPTIWTITDRERSSRIYCINDSLTPYMIIGADDIQYMLPFVIIIISNRILMDVQ